MTLDHFTRANEGTYTVQIHDGKAKTQSSLVLVGDGESRRSERGSYGGFILSGRSIYLRMSRMHFVPVSSHTFYMK